MPNFFYFDQSNQKYGPVSDQQLKALAAQGVINPNTPMETDTGHKGLAGQIPGLFVAVSPSMPKSPPAPVAVPTREGVPQESFLSKTTASGRSAMDFISSALGLLLAVTLVFVVGGVFWWVLETTNVIPTNYLSKASAPAEQEEAARLARLAQCSDNQKQIMLALHNYNDVNGVLPPLYTVDANGKPLHSWRVLILFLLAENALYDEIRLDEPWDSEYNKQFHNRMPSVYQCPGNPKKGCCYSALGIAMLPRVRLDMPAIISVANRESSNILTLVEVREPFNWMDPKADIMNGGYSRELERGINAGGQMGSHHAGGMNAAFLDGSIRFLADNTSPEELLKLGGLPK